MHKLLDSFRKFELKKYFQNMYYVTIAVLVVVAIVESIGRGFPLNLVVAVFASSFLDVAIKMFWLKRNPAMPLSAIITGLIIGMVSVNVPVLGVLIAAVLAIVSKFIVRLNGRHIFNPAVFGVLISMAFNPAAHNAVANAAGHIAQSSSEVAAGFGPGGFSVSLILVPLLLFANHRARKLWTSIPNIVASAFLFYFAGLASFNLLNLSEFIEFIQVLPFYFAFIIISEPKTSPYDRKYQAAFGVGIAILSVLPLFILGSYFHIGALAAVLAGNLIYAVLRKK